jgi:hypothetical protein
VLRFQRLPFPLDRRLGLLKSLVGTRQHPGEGNRRCFWLGVGSEPPPKNHLRLLQSGRRIGVGRAPRVTPMAGVGAAGTSSVAADGVLDDVAVVQAAVAISSSPGPLPVDACC